MNRREAITASVVSAAAAVYFPTAASAAKKRMGPKFDSELQLAVRGLVIHAAGPVGTWEWDTDYGYVSTVIVQDRAKAHGMSDRVHRGDDRWRTFATADSNHHFHPGPAMAHGVLLIPDGGEAYSYAWTVPVELVQR